MEAFDPFAPEIRANPYPLYRRMRETDPVHWSEEHGAHMLTRYADCSELLRSPGVSVDARNAELTAERLAQREDMIERQTALIGPQAFIMQAQPMLFSDPPDHTRLRGLVSKAFTPRRVEELRPHIESIVDDLIDPLVGRDEIDVIGDVGFPLPVIVIAQLLGVPLEDREQLKGWSRDLARTIDPVITDEVAMRAATSGMQFVNYLNGLIDERRQQPRDDLLSALITAEEEGQHLSHPELLVNCILLFIAGHETTQNLIGNGMLALLRHPDQLARVRDEPALAKGAVEEMLRFDAPVQLTARHLLEDRRIGDVNVRKGETVILLLAAANRDPAQFEDPDRLDITRPDANRHIAFGSGVHFCLGAPLARVEAQVAIPAMLRRLGPMEPAEPEPPYAENFTLRGMARLRVAMPPRG
ncbi:MAG TPA: cytochrome P450 [Acidimicrobiales bacterium]|nr:cytochrome P450 [Acidimicrobiales bacterium]